MQLYSSESTSIQCKYDVYTYTVVGNIYYCWIKKGPQILTQETAHIDAALGTHSSSKHDNDVLGFWVRSGVIHYFPQGLDKIYANLELIYIIGVKLKEVHQSDLKPFTKLMELDLSKNQIEIIDEGLFEFNNELKYISFEDNEIYHIPPDVFNNLKFLKYLKFEKNKCISKSAKNSYNIVNELTRGLNETCLSFEYKYMREKFRALETATLILNSDAFNARTNDLEKQIGRSKFSNFYSFQNILQSAKNVSAKNF